jgi:uncharacterized RDD family membrane protein YckC
VVSWLSLFVLVEILGRLLGGDPLGRASATSQLTSMSGTRTLVGIALVITAYEIVPVAVRGATLGKAMLGLRVVRVDTFGPPDALSAVIRGAVLYAPLAVPTVGFFLFLLVAAPAVIWPTRRGLHDVAAGTVVIAIGHHEPDRGLDEGEP